MKDVRSVNVAICEALGIDPMRVSEVIITLSPDRLPSVVTRRDWTDGPTGPLLRALSEVGVADA